MHGPVPLLHDYLIHSARHLGGKVALVCGKRRITYSEIEARSNAIAHHLVASGVARGDRVIIFADNTVETVVSFWAVLKANAVVCIVNPLTKRDKLRYLLNDCQPSALITDKHLYPIFKEPAEACPSLRRVIVSGSIDDAELTGLPHAVHWDVAGVAGHDAPPARSCIDIDLAAIVYTSGSTGDPKGVMLTHRNMLAACTSIASYLALCEDEVILNVLPLAFDYGLYQMIMAFRTGARLVPRTIVRFSGADPRAYRGRAGDRPARRVDDLLDAVGAQVDKGARSFEHSLRHEHRGCAAGEAHSSAAGSAPGGAYLFHVRPH